MDQRPSVYGPLFTFLSAPFANTSVAFNEFAFKLIAAAASGGTLYLIWKCAQRRGVSPARGVALFGLNPLVTLYGVGGGHNDLLMLLLTTGGIYAVLSAVSARRASCSPPASLSSSRPRSCCRLQCWARRDATSVTGGTALLVGVVVTSLAVAAASYAAFGTSILHMTHTLRTVQDQGDWQSLPGFFFTLTHVTITSPVRDP